MLRLALALVVLAAWPVVAAAQVGVTNPATPPIMVPQGHPNAGQPGFAIDPGAPAFNPARPASEQQRPAVPFTTDPHPFNDPHPTMPNAGLGHSGQTGPAVRQLWVQPQLVTLVVYVPAPPGVPAEWQTQYATIPGYMITETTNGFFYPERWTIDQLNAGVYQWRRLPPEYRAR